MKTLRQHAKGLLVVIGGIVALVASSAASLRADGGSKSYCTSDCDRAIEHLKCTAGTTCEAVTCTGRSGRLFAYELTCAGVQ